VYKLDAASSAPLRQVLMETYQAAGWIGQETGRMIHLTALAERVEAISQQSYVPSEVAAALRTRCALPLRDMAATAVKVLAVPYASTFSLTRPLVVETGWVGSDLSRSLLRACLWVWYTLALAKGPSSSPVPRGVVGLEEAHTLFGTPDSEETISTLTPLVSGSLGTLLVDDRPDLLKMDIASKAALTVLTRLANAESLEWVATVMGATPRQQERMVRLNGAEAVISLRGAAPVMVSLRG